ncbi:MAG: leucine-rich repeat domain-containing protein, partial [Bacteroidaceae bacterium]
TTIGNSAFNGCSGLTSITIPNSVTTIGNWAFFDCSGLTAITIGNSVTTIGNSAFNGCSRLMAITIPNSVTTIGDWAFSGCTGLTSITIPNSVTTIGNNAFDTCSGLTSITIPNSVTTIGEGVFSHCIGLQEIKVYIEEPINIIDNVFGFVDYSTCKLYVPQGSIDKYKNAAVWNKFSTILALTDGSAIEGVDEDKLNVYSVDGKVVIKNLREGEAISICNTTGQNVYQGNETEVPLNKGIYFVKVGTIVSKVMVQ